VGLNLNAGPVSAAARSLADALPDTPGWIDTRGMLLSGRATIFGGRTVDEGFAVRATSGPYSVVSVAGRPEAVIIAHALEGATNMTAIIAQRGNAEYVHRALAERHPSGSDIQWTPERAILHRLAAPPHGDTTGDVPTRLLQSDDRLDHLPSELQSEIAQARELAPVAVALIDGIPASFCYPCWMTETLWDVSIDTLEPHRRRGLAARVVQHMIDVMKQGGRDPVWGAMESNVASLELARKLGFTPVDEIVVFSRGTLH
jgi:GNAT superfamily N-acetyltransferase